VVTKAVYGDDLAQVRRTERMSVAAELLWQLLPPLTYACRRFVISAVLEPCYQVGGDGFDYAVGKSTAFLTDAYIFVDGSKRPKPERVRVSSATLFLA
jgi:hypothetical protein